jgi:hypothetical protein
MNRIYRLFISLVKFVTLYRDILYGILDWRQPSTLKKYLIIQGLLPTYNNYICCSFSSKQSFRSSYVVHHTIFYQYHLYTKIVAITCRNSGNVPYFGVMWRRTSIAFCVLQCSSHYLVKEWKTVQKTVIIYLKKIRLALKQIMACFSHKVWMCCCSKIKKGINQVHLIVLPIEEFNAPTLQLTAD